MNTLTRKFRLSALSLTKPQNVAICGMLLALRVLIGYFSNLTLAITPDIKLGFSFLPIAMAGILCGPVAGGAVGALGDIISFLLVPMGAYFPGWTISGLLVGTLYGVFLYNCKRFLPSLIICEIVIGIFVEIILGSLWLYIQFSKGFWLMASTRGLKTLVAVPIEILTVYLFDKIIIKRVKKNLEVR